MEPFYALKCRSWASLLGGNEVPSTTKFWILRRDEIRVDVVVEGFVEFAPRGGEMAALGDVFGQQWIKRSSAVRPGARTRP